MSCLQARQAWVYLSVLFAGVFFPANVSFGADATPGGKLTRQQATFLEQTIWPAYEQGDSAGIVRAMSPLAMRWQPAHFAAADQWLEEKNAPPLRRVVGGARLRIAEQNLPTNLPRPSTRELAWTIETVAERVRETVAASEIHPALDAAAELPRNMKGFEDLFWSMHVLENQLRNARRLADYGRQLVGDASKLPTKTLTAEERDAMTTDFPELIGQVNTVGQQMRQREIELRLERLVLADGVLTDSADRKERFRAAFALDLDGELLKKPLRLDEPLPAEDSEWRRRSELARRHIEHGLQVAGDELIGKSRSLFTGLHWWMRGRYGAGTDGYGLLKSRQALASPEAQFALYMPSEPPRPTPPSSSPAIPLVDRRHHYLWQFETRDVVVAQLRSGRTSAISPDESHLDGIRNLLPPDLRSQAATSTIMSNFW